jgi:TPP-dependent pyruvate/acetoin dehydrogenase alpha subunit
MKRYPAYDPPEYIDWSADPEVMKEFRKRIGADEARRAIIARLRPDEHLRLYRGLIRSRLHDIMVKRWVRQGITSKAWLGTGEEAVTVGAVHALAPGDVVGPMIRNAGAYHEMGIDLADVLRNYLGTGDSPTGGRDLHMGNLDRGVVAPISMVGALVPVCAGIALSFKMRKQENLALTWAGDGSTRTTDFHEGLVCAKRFRAPLVIFIQDNQIALGTTRKSYSLAPLEEAAKTYGTVGYTCDGNHVLDVYATTSLAAELCRAGLGPVIVTATTMRMGGHATHDEGESRQLLAPELFEYWGKRDPIGTYETYLKEAGFRLSPTESNAEALSQIEKEVLAEVDRAADEALDSRQGQMPRPETQRQGVFLAS